MRRVIRRLDPVISLAGCSGVRWRGRIWSGRKCACRGIPVTRVDFAEDVAGLDKDRQQRVISAVNPETAGDIFCITGSIIPTICQDVVDARINPQGIAGLAIGCLGRIEGIFPVIDPDGKNG